MLQLDGAEASFDAYRELTQLVYSGLLLLDAKDFTGWLALCAAEVDYAIRAWSPEIRKEMTWLEHDRSGITTLVQQLPRHNTDQSIFTRHATVYTVDLDVGEDTASIVSSVSIYRTDLDGGSTGLFAVGRYHDRAVYSDGRWLLRSRELRLHTRSLGIGTHYLL